jgi:hypothetical protein
VTGDGIVAAVAIAAVLVRPVAAFVRWRVARAGFRSAKAAVPVARDVMWRAAGRLVVVVLVAAVVLAGGLLMVYMASTPER